MSTPLPRQDGAAEESSETGLRGLFDATPWSHVLAAGDSKHPQRHAALESLCETYWPPLHAYILRRVTDPHLAQDLTQSFFERLLAGRSLRLADPARGRFRIFLVQAFEWHLSNDFREKRTIRRGGAVRTVSLDFRDVSRHLNDDASLSPEQVFEKQWALALLQKTLDRLRQEQSADEKKASEFEILKEFLTGQEPLVRYATVCDRLGLSEPAARMAVSRLRARYRAIIREEIQRTVSSSEDVEDEIRQLFRALSLR